jgi:hypothetical protein
MVVSWVRELSSRVESTEMVWDFAPWLHGNESRFIESGDERLVAERA